MAWTTKHEEAQTHREQLYMYTVDDLKKMAKLFSTALPTRKADLIDVILFAFEGDKKLRARWKELSDLQQKAVAMTIYSDPPVLDKDRFHARYGAWPDLGNTDRWASLKDPSLLLVFLPHGTAARDLTGRLRAFVPELSPMAVPATEQYPECIEISRWDYDIYARTRKKVIEKHLLVQVDTERPAQHDLQTVLRLIDTRKMQVGPKTRRLSAKDVKAVEDVLFGGEYYQEIHERSDFKETPGPIKAFAWPMILQSGGFVETAGNRLQLTSAGRKALSAEPPAQLRILWKKWLKTTILDEFNRVDMIKGQTGRGKKRMTSASGRRNIVVEALGACPPGAWISVDDFSRFMVSNNYHFEVVRDPWDLYISSTHYGSLGYDGYHDWHILQARFIMTFLFEYAATMGLIDVAYTDPNYTRADFRDLWGTDDMTFLSRYDGLRYFRINALGTWCLNLTDLYTPPEPEKRAIFNILPTMDIVATGVLQPGDRLFVEQIAKQISDNVWKLSSDRLLTLCEQGQNISDIVSRLTADSEKDLPHTVEVFFKDLNDRINRLTDAGPAHLIEVVDAETRVLLAHDTRLSKYCMPAGDRYLVVPTSAEASFRKALKKMGYTVKFGGG